MSIFGQVWLWSAAAFVVGVLLTWLFLARPAQARSRHLERRLLAAQSAPAAPARTFDREPVSAPVKREPVVAEQPEPEQAEEHRAAPSWLERDSLAGRSPGYQPGSEIDDDSLFESEPEPEYRTSREPAAEATTVFNPFGRERDEAAERGALFVGDQGARHEAPEQAAEPGQGARHQAPEPEDAGFGRGSLFEREAPEPAAEGGSLFQPETPAADGGALFERESATGHGSLFDQANAPDPERGSLFDPDHAPEPPRPQESAFAPFAAPEQEPPAYAFSSEEPEAPAAEETAAETTQVLPRRQPRQSAHAFDSPRPVQPSMRTVERREPEPEASGRSRSLFEPTPRATRGHADAVVPPGPFGPGSAMPRPGGGKPSEEFTVKASVTALRYCTEDSPQFDRMVAEVWFRSAEDAERVGFRSL